jgi:hypothetical protein
MVMRSSEHAISVVFKIHVGVSSSSSRARVFEFVCVSNTCESGDATSLVGAAEAVTARPQPAEPGTADVSAAATAATLLAALRDNGASVAAVRRHLAALSELARDPAAAAALQWPSVMASGGGASVARAAAALMLQLGDAAEADGTPAEEDNADA